MQLQQSRIGAYRQWIQQDSNEEQDQDEEDEANEQPFKSPPHNELHGLAWIGEPEEWRFRAPVKKYK